MQNKTKQWDFDSCVCLQLDWLCSLVSLWHNQSINRINYFQYNYHSNLVLTLQADAYSIETIQLKGAADATKTTAIFSNGRVGVAYLF